MTVTPVLAARLRAGETLVSGWCGIPEPLVMEGVARAEFDCVTLDVQHGFHDVASIVTGIGGILLAGKPALVRIPVGDNALASRVLDMGAEAVIAPMINSAAEARVLVAAIKYPPLGERSWGPSRVLALRGSDPQAYLQGANGVSLAFAMIETRRALDALDDILAVEGLDGVFVGPSDLSIALSDGREIAPGAGASDETIRLIAGRARAAGKLPGIFAVAPEHGRRFRDYGYRLIALGTDQMYLAGGARAMLKAFSAPPG